MTVVEQVVLKLKERIFDGTFRAGEQLPSLRRLAELLGVSHETARAALQHLVAKGYLWIRGGAAMRVEQVEISGGLDVLLDRVSFLLSRADPLSELPHALRDLERLHRVVFGETAALAAARHERHEGDALLFRLGDLETQLPRGSPEQTFERQWLVVAAVASAAHSRAFRLTLNAIHRIWAEVLRHVEISPADTAPLAYFDPLEKAISERNPVLARQLVLERPYPGWSEAITKLASSGDTPGSAAAR